MTDARTLTYTFRSPCAYCANVVREDVEYSAPYDAEGHHVFTGGVECYDCFLIVCIDCLPRLGRCRVQDYWVDLCDRRCNKTGGLSHIAPLRSPYVFVWPKTRQYSAKIPSISLLEPCSKPEPR